MRISDWSSDVCSSDLPAGPRREEAKAQGADQACRARLLAAREAPGNLRQVEHHTEGVRQGEHPIGQVLVHLQHEAGALGGLADARGGHLGPRSEEHTSELQSLMRISYAVFCLKKNKQ